VTEGEGTPPPAALPPVHPDLGRGLSLWQLIRADYHGLVALEPDRSLRRYVDVLAQPGFYAVLIFRLSVVFHRAGLIPIARILFLLNLLLFGTEMGPRARVGPGLVVPHPICTGFSGTTRIGRNVVILAGAHLGAGGYPEPGRDGFPTIGDGCHIMDGAKILGPVEIGAGAVIGANALVMRSIPAGAVVVSPPARIVRVQAAENAPESTTS
jgi:serine O-acetyltransferase